MARLMSVVTPPNVLQVDVCDAVRLARRRRFEFASCNSPQHVEAALWRCADQRLQKRREGPVVQTRLLRSARAASVTHPFPRTDGSLRYQSIASRCSTFVIRNPRRPMRYVSPRRMIARSKTARSALRSALQLVDDWIEGSAQSNWPTPCALEGSRLFLLAPLDSVNPTIFDRG